MSGASRSNAQPSAPPPGAAKTDRVEGLLSAIERHVHQVMTGRVDEVSASLLATVLRDLATIRVEMQRPSALEKRTSLRFHEAAIVALERADGRCEWAAVVDISVGGALLETDAVFAEQEECLLTGPGLVNKVRAMVLSSDGAHIRLRFQHMTPQDAIEFSKYAERHIERYQ